MKRSGYTNGTNGNRPMFSPKQPGSEAAQSIPWQEQGRKHGRDERPRPSIRPGLSRLLATTMLQRDLGHLQDMPLLSFLLRLSVSLSLGFSLILHRPLHTHQITTLHFTLLHFTSLRTLDRTHSSASTSPILHSYSILGYLFFPFPFPFSLPSRVASVVWPNPMMPDPST